jgi:dTMP kinase
VDAALIDALALAVHGDLKPDCTLLLDLPVGAGLARARTRPGATADRFEAETFGFFEKVRAGYLALARREPQRFRIVDAAAPLAEVEQRIAEALGALRTQGARA